MTRTLALSLLLALALSACDNKRDHNGDLGGMWQLTRWVTPQGETAATNEDGIYYHFQLQLMKVNQNGVADIYLAYFTHTPDSLIVDHAYLRPDEQEVSLTELARFGVPADGRFHVDALTSNAMVLTGAEGTLTFRKY